VPTSAKLSRRCAITALNVCLVLTSLSLALVVGQSKAQEEKAEPWSGAEVLRPDDLVRQIGQKTGQPRTLVYVGFRTLFEGGHVPGAKFYGSASTEKGLADLKAALADLSRSTELVIYCGCCPLEKCPNIRPAYKALRGMGFTHLRVLMLPTSFAKDWIEKGYPIEKGL
jgi:thiosulfate/3-mercaptopyruvate sulfurtransferase